MTAASSPAPPAPPSPALPPTLPQADWAYPTEIRFGTGRIAELGTACREAGISHPLFVTDRGLAALPVAQTARDALKASGLRHGFFAEVDPNPTAQNLAGGIAAFREGGHDGVVAFGGGSGLDLGKLIAFMSGQTLPVATFEDVGDNWKRADAAAIAPSIAVPTTAGTGSEAGRAAVIAEPSPDGGRLVKRVIFHPRMLPACVIADPALTAGMPPAITAGTGMDAFAHALEAWCAPGWHPMADGIALEGMRLVKENLTRAFHHGDDLAARGGMMAAAAMGATAFQKGLGGIHAVSHAIGALHGTHHGTTNAAVMAAVLRFNRPAIEEKIARASAYLAIDGASRASSPSCKASSPSSAFPQTSPPSA